MRRKIVPKEKRSSLRLSTIMLTTITIDTINLTKSPFNSKISVANAIKQWIPFIRIRMLYYYLKYLTVTTVADYVHLIELVG